MEFIFQYPKWFVAFCFFLGFVYSLVLYFKDNSFVEDSKSIRIVKWGMALFRLLSVSLLSFLLLSPLIKTRYIDKIQPSIILAHDNSESILLGFSKIDSAQYLARLNQLYSAIEEKYLLDFYLFSDKIYSKDTLQFSAKRTNISNSLEELNGNYFNRNVGALVLATDGIYNEGNNPIYSDIDFPIYIIALGDTNTQRDLKITQINANKIAYLGDKLKVDIDIAASNCKGEKFSVSLYNKNNKLIEQKQINTTENYSEKQLSYIIAAKQVGIQKYTVKVESVENEISYENNSSDFYVDVIDSRQKILLIADAPHPDISALKQSISSNKNLVVDIMFANNILKQIRSYDLVILHNLPSKKHGFKATFEQIKTEKIPYFIIAASAIDYSALNKVQNMLNVKLSAQSSNDASNYFDPNFSLFNFNENTAFELSNLPPVKVPFAQFKQSANIKNVLKQKIGSVETDYPILSIQENFGQKSAIFVGEGLWRWRMHNFLEQQNHNAFDEVFQKTINYLALKSDKRKFRVFSPKNIFFETEELRIEAELYNESYELVNEPEIDLEIRNENGALFPQAMSKTKNAYLLKSAKLPKGNYSYQAKVSYAGKNYSANGAFSIKALQLEALQTKANHNMLHQLAAKTGGKVYYPNQIKALEKELLTKQDIKPSLFQSYKTRSIIHLKWIFFVLMALLSTEWFARKFNGAY